MGIAGCRDDSHFNGVVNAQWVDHETLARMMSSAAGNRVAKSPQSTAATAGSHGLSVDKGVTLWSEQEFVGWQLDRNRHVPARTGRPPLNSLTSIHDDGTFTANDQGSVITDPHRRVSTAGVGVWTRLKNRTFAYTQLNLFSDLSSNLVGFLKVRGMYTLSVSGDEYTGTPSSRCLIRTAASSLKARWKMQESESPWNLPP